jgi:chromosome segregation ATPase
VFILLPVCTVHCVQSLKDELTNSPKRERPTSQSIPHLEETLNKLTIAEARAQHAEATVEELTRENEELNLDILDISDEYAQLQEMHDQLVEALAEARDNHKAFTLTVTMGCQTDSEITKVRSHVYGARFPAEIYTRGCHWIPRMFA